MQRELADADTDTARDAREVLDRLEDMAQDRIELFYDKIGYACPPYPYAPHRSDFRHPHSHDENDRQLIPIMKVLNKYTYIGIKHETNDGWLNDLTEGIKQFSTGPISDGLSSVAANTITRMLSSTAGRCQIEQR